MPILDCIQPERALVGSRKQVSEGNPLKEPLDVCIKRVPQPGGGAFRPVTGSGFGAGARVIDRLEYLSDRDFTRREAATSPARRSMANSCSR